MYDRLRYRLRHSNRLGLVCLAVAVALAMYGGTTLVRGLSEQRSVAATKDRGDIPRPDVQPVAGHFLSYAAPLTIRIPSIGVDSPLITVGKAADGTIGTPQAPDFDKAAWYRDSPAPGQYGAAVIVGHVDSYASGNGASVFYNLSKLRPGDQINVEREDRTTASFEVYATRQYPRDDMPTEQVYGSNSANAELRLITCAGSFDTAAGEYTNNTVIFARLANGGNAG